jgi:hypothetical protein
MDPVSIAALWVSPSIQTAGARGRKIFLISFCLLQFAPGKRGEGHPETENGS